MRVVMMRAPVMPNGWPRAIRATVHIELVVVDAQMLGRGKDLSGERLVDLDQVDVVDGHPGPSFSAMTGSFHRAQTHDFGVESTVTPD